MNREEIFEKLNVVFRDVFDDDSIVVNDNTTADDIEDWDSLAQVRLTVAIEKKFSIKFDFGELASLHNVGEMLELIEKKIAD